MAEVEDVLGRMSAHTWDVTVYGRDEPLATGNVGHVDRLRIVQAILDAAPSNYQAVEMVACAIADRKAAEEEVERLRAALEAIVAFGPEYSVEGRCQGEHAQMRRIAREALAGDR